jgi:hypothetical protein
VTVRVAGSGKSLCGRGLDGLRGRLAVIRAAELDAVSAALRGGSAVAQAVNATPAASAAIATVESHRSRMGQM